MRIPKCTALALATALVAAGEAAAQKAATVGDRPTYSWQGAIVNGQGVKSLADLQGRPVLVEFWGTG